MKIVYVIATNTDKLNGIGNKVVNQVSSWVDLGEKPKVLAFSTVKGEAMSSIPGRVLSMKAPFGITLLRKPWRVVQYLKGLFYLFLWRPNIIYVRASEKPHGSRFWNLLDAKVICEVNADVEQQNVIDLQTGAVDELGAERRLRLWSESLRACDAMVSVSYQMDAVNSKFLIGQPHAVAWNSIRFDSVKKIKRANHTNKLPKLCFIGAECFAWNGVDLLRAFAEKTIGKLEFVVIGASDDYDFPPNVEIHPYLEHDQMMEVLAACDVGMSQMAIFRKGLSESSTLKVRDYVTIGLPMLLAYKETPFVGLDLPEWVLEIENEEDTMNLNETKIIEFAEKWKGRSFDPSLAKPFFDSSIVEQQRLDFFKEVYNAD